MINALFVFVEDLEEEEELVEEVLELEFELDDVEVVLGVEASFLSELDVIDDLDVLGEQLTRISNIILINEIEISCFMSIFFQI